LYYKHINNKNIRIAVVVSSNIIAIIVFAI
jgi:hypothetical protein